MKTMRTKETMVIPLLEGDRRGMDELIPNILLRSARRQTRWTQKDVAQRIGVSVLSVGRWERGETIPNGYAQAMLCKLFRRSAEALGLADEKEAGVDEQIQPANQLSTDSRELNQSLGKRGTSGHRVPFHQQLKYEREQRGWSQAELAEKVESDIKTVNRWETGKSSPQPLYRRRLYELFGKNAEEFGLLEELHPQKENQPQRVEQPYPTRRTFALSLPVHCGDCEQPEIVAFLDTIQVDPSRDRTKFSLQFANGTEEDMGLSFESLSLVDQSGDFFLGQSVGSFLLGAGRTSVLTVIFDWMPRAKEVYRLNVVLIRPGKWRNTYKPIPLKF